MLMTNHYLVYHMLSDKSDFVIRINGGWNCSSNAQLGWPFRRWFTWQFRSQASFPRLTKSWLRRQYQRPISRRFFSASPWPVSCELSGDQEKGWNWDGQPRRFHFPP